MRVKPYKRRVPSETGKVWERHIDGALDAERRAGTSAVFKSPDSFGKRLKDGTYIPVKQPVDFMGCWRGHAVAFDAKSMESGWRFTFSKRVGDHQMEMIQALGRAGAIAGLLVEVRDRREAYWVPWWHLTGSGVDLQDCCPLSHGLTSIPWRSLLCECQIPAEVIEGGGTIQQHLRVEKPGLEGSCMATYPRGGAK